jgi:hypothetical protein
MQYSHQAQLSEITGLPALGEPPVAFWSGNVRHLITARDDEGWSLLESAGSLVGEFVSEDGRFAILDEDGGDRERFDNWRSAVRHILRRGLRAA